MRLFPSPGDSAPQLQLTDASGREVTVGARGGGPLVLVFVPGDGSPICVLQLQSYSARLGEFADLGATLLAISPRDPESHARFAEAAGVELPLLSDEDKEAGRSYGILGPMGAYRRSVFVIDGAGVVRYARRATERLRFWPARELLEAVARTRAGAR